MASRNQSIRFYSRLSAVLLLVVLVLLNVAATRSSARVDLTEEGIYTLSKASKGVLGSLEDPATIKVFWHNVPERGEIARRYVDSLLREMKTSARGQLAVRWVDMEDPEGEKEAQDAGVQVREYQQAGEGELKLARGYDALVIEVGDETEIVPGLVNLGDRLEYETITRLYKMTRVEELVVGMVTPQPAFNPFAGAQAGRFRTLENALRQLYGTGLRAHVSLDEPLPDDIDVLLVAGPKDMSEKAVFNFEQFLLRGGRAILLLDPVHSALDQAPDTQAESSGFEDWLAHLGLTVESGVVGDWARGAYLNRPRILRGGLITFRPYPYWVAVTSDRLDQDNPATQGFGVVPLYWPAAFSVDEEKQEGASRKVTVLGKTSEYGYRRPDLIALDDGERDDVREEDVEPFIPLLLLLDGQVESFWTGKEAPKDDPAAAGGPGGMPPGMGGIPGMPPGMPRMMPPSDVDDDAPEDGEEAPADEVEAPADEEDAPADEEDTGPPKLESGKALLVIATDAELVGDDAARLGGEFTYGFPFVFNLVDWMGGSEELLALRARTRTSRTIADIEPNQQKLIKWGHFSVIPLLSLLAGIVVFIVRRYQR